jgi:putative redox protein
MDASVKWQQRMTFQGSADSGFILPLGTDPGVGGDNDGFRPMELFAIGLAGCTAMDVVSILAKKREQVTGFDIQLHVERAETYPKVFTAAVIEYHVTGQHISEEAVRRAIELSVEIYCPAHAMLSQVMPIELKYFLYEGQDGEQRKLVRSGEYQTMKEADPR